ncbi:2-(1,2-epoxy-1,2-dihydrophenyl)acetyl-CoA isomerase PaaG [Variovorax dokdonensis]|uniref:2-(1,2-epoxy-1,2-dihydrophenyl)acetyl-CoA isomerase PaaG n=1 Tax=Variovorax dokdonensis TaxID=344883 RepID=A0ABT7N5Z8_9BURK|nr:enoyl-CoA hydratase-related protein [Variovorax dokdonensis]MDM0043374.1 2-(1,2-epoxy-1,2-dihydrophenyl)acetyl-CoA isomerase PaaG [Variovorax dokdonensis]
MSNEALILQSDTGATRTLTLNRPAAMNSFTTAMHRELMSALDMAVGSAEVRCLVITGAGRGFCAGQDLSDPEAAPGKDLGALINTYYLPLVQRIRSMPMPVIAAVNGVAAGAGANLALCCDFVLAARSASFIQAFAKIGLVPDTGGTWLLPRLVGQARATGLAMLGDKLPAADAAAMGLIWQCVDDAAMPEAVTALAGRLAAMPTRALVATREALAAAQGMDLEQALRHEARLQTELGGAHDYLEGVDAFRNKRAPRFTDR